MTTHFRSIRATTCGPKLWHMNAFTSLWNNKQRTKTMPPERILKNFGKTINRPKLCHVNAFIPLWNTDQRTKNTPLERLPTIMERRQTNENYATWLHGTHFCHHGTTTSGSNPCHVNTLTQVGNDGSAVQNHHETIPTQLGKDICIHLIETAWRLI